MKFNLSENLKQLRRELKALTSKYNSRADSETNLLLAKLLYSLTLATEPQPNLLALKNTALAVECLSYALEQQSKNKDLTTTILLSDCFYSEAILKVVLTQEPFIVKSLAAAISETALKKVNSLDNSIMPLVKAVFDLAAYFGQKNQKQKQRIAELKELYEAGKLDIRHCERWQLK